MFLEKYDEFEQKQLEALIEQGVAKDEKGYFFLAQPLVELHLEAHREFLKRLMLQRPVHPSSSKACFLLGQLKDVTAIEQLCTALTGVDDVEVRKTAGQVLGELGIDTDPIMYDLTLALVMDPEWSVKVAAATAMAKIDVARTIEYIVGYVGKRTNDPNSIGKYRRFFQALLDAASTAEPDVSAKLNTIIQALSLSDANQEVQGT